MAIDFDTSRAPRSHQQLVDLVEAVLRAREHDEYDWLEWKSFLDLNTKEGVFAVAKQILGMANRPVAASARCEGVGYVVVGASPAGLDGITPVDPAHLHSLVDLYVGGSDGPTWNSIWIELRGAHVLIVIVEPPRIGDRIWTLRREFGGHREGVPFVRRPGRSDPANTEQLRLLEKRLTDAQLPSTANIGVAWGGSVPLVPVDWPALHDELAKFADLKARQLLEAARKVEERRNLPSATDPFRILSKTAALRATSLGGRTRTMSDFEAEVDAYRVKLTEALRQSMLYRYVNLGYGTVVPVINNESDRFLEQVEVRMTLPKKGVYVSLDAFEDGAIPDAPQPYTGEPESYVLPLIDVGLLSPKSQQWQLQPPLGAPTQRLESHPDRFELIVEMQQLRPRSRWEGRPLYMLVSPATPAIDVAWDATARGVDAVMTGAAVLPTSADQLPVGSLWLVGDFD